MLYVHPEDCLIDEKIHVKICSLKPHQRTTLRCETIEKNYVYDSYAHYIADYNGEVDLSLSPSFGGSYKGIDAMGIFWSMLPANGQMLGLKYKAEDVTKPCHYTLQVYDGFLTDDHFPKKHLKTTTSTKYPIFEKTINRRFCAKSVTREEISYGSVRGVLYTPRGPGPFKGVIDLYGSGGGLMDIKAPLFASHGFVSMVLPIFRYKDLTDDISEFEVEYVLEAIDYLSGLPFVLPGISIVGLSWGASIVMILAADCDKLSGVVSINGSPLFWPVRYKGTFFPDPFDLEKLITFEEFGKDKRGGDISYLKLKNEDSGEFPDSCTLKVEKTKAKVLLLHGEADMLYESKLSPKWFEKRMQAFGKGDCVTYISYPGAGHFLEPPYMPQTLIQYNATFSQLQAIGGEEVEHAMACVAAWKELLHFLQVNTGTFNMKAKL